MFPLSSSVWNISDQGSMPVWRTKELLWKTPSTRSLDHMKSPYFECTSNCHFWHCISQTDKFLTNKQFSSLIPNVKLYPKLKRNQKTYKMFLLLHLTTWFKLHLHAETLQCSKAESMKVWISVMSETKQDTLPFQELNNMDNRPGTFNLIDKYCALSRVLIASHYDSRLKS